MALTTKQEKFCQEVVKQPTYSAAYRIAYDAENMSDEVVNVKASELLKNGKITVRVQELKEAISKKELYTLEKSIARDIKLIERYENALNILEDKESKAPAITAAERTIRFIGSGGYNSAQDRLSKQHGFYELDNDQKKDKLPSKEEREQFLSEFKKDLKNG